SYLLAHGIGSAVAHHRTQRRLGVGRVAEAQRARLGHERVHELVVAVAVHVDPLDPATRLPRVEEGPVDEIGGGRLDGRVGPYIGRVLAAEFEAETDETTRRGAHDGMATADRSGERDEVDARVADHG